MIQVLSKNVCEIFFKCAQFAGRYSLGGGIRFEEFVTLPEGFSVENFDPSAGIFSDSSSSSSGTKTVCPLEWVFFKLFIRYNESLKAVN